MFLSQFQHALSQLIGKLAFCRWKWLKNWLIRLFMSYYQVDLSEAEQQELSAYPHFNAFFVRALKTSSRKVDADPSVMVSPVDGIISQYGTSQKGQLIQAKKFNYLLLSLLTPEFSCLSQFSEAKFATLYLAPRNYHRVHMPLTGKLQKMWFVPGSLYSVNEKSVNQIQGVFARNERVITLFETKAGLMIMVLIGAMLVRSISTSWEGIIAPNKLKKIISWNYQTQNITLEKGQEMGRFQYGSTVIVLFENENIQWNAALKSGDNIVLGQKLWYIFD